MTKFDIGDLVAYKKHANANYLFGKDYGIVVGYGKGQENQTYYKVYWTPDSALMSWSLFCYAQLELIAKAKGV